MQLSPLIEKPEEELNSLPFLTLRHETTYTGFAAHAIYDEPATDIRRRSWYYGAETKDEAMRRLHAAVTRFYNNHVLVEDKGPIPSPNMDECCREL
jgi:hypothetical protein